MTIVKFMSLKSLTHSIQLNVTNVILAKISDIVFQTAAMYTGP